MGRSTVRALAAAGVIGVLAGPASAALANQAPEPPAVVINEVETDSDWVELTNTGETAVDVSGWIVKDDNDGRTLSFPAGSQLQPGEFLTIDTDAGDAGFGLGREDEVRIFLPDGATEVDAYSWTAHPATSYGRCPDGTGDFATTAQASKGEPNVCAAAAADALVINEIESQGGEPGDWVELRNLAGVPVDAAGLVFSDADDSHAYTLPAGTEVPAGGHLVLDEADFGFGLGGEDSARLFDADGTTLIDSHSWTSHAATTYGRCADGTGAFTTTAAPTKGATNECAPPAGAGDVVINEVESNGDDTDWVELRNNGAEAIDLSGHIFRDEDDSRGYELPAGSVIGAGELFVIDQQSATQPGFDFGLGNPDTARLFAPDGATLLAEYAWDVHAPVTYGRCPDGTGEMQETTVSTKGEPNDCSTPLRINEIESSGGTPGDWIELFNAGAADLDASGLVVKDADDGHAYALPTGSTVPAGGFLVLDELSGEVDEGFDFGLGGDDRVRLFEADGTTLIDEHAWTAHAPTTYGRCPDGTGEFTVTQEPSKGESNRCEGVTPVQVWPGGEDIEILDDEGAFAGDLSGIDHEPSSRGGPGTLWAVENGNGLLYRIVADDSGGWAPDAAEGWGEGKTLRYPDGSGIVDAEGVTVTEAGAAGGVYIASERNNDAGSVSRPSVLRYDVSGGDQELSAEAEWNLAPDFPGLGANAGLEGVTWIPDGFLTAAGFVDESTGQAYDPSSYPGHGGGLFLVGVEGTASVYAYALMDDRGFARVATVESSFAIVADVQFDPDREALWVVCDEACRGRTATFAIDAEGAFAETAVYERPAGMPDIANEGFAFADASQCVDGRVPTFYTDDNDTDGFSLRSGTLDCEVAGPGEPTPTPTGEPTEQPDAIGEPTEQPDASAPGGGAGSSDLPRTGAEALAPLVAALVLAGIGALLLWLARRKS